MEKIYPRAILPEIQKFLSTRDVVVILGARQTGKSTLLKLLMQSVQNPVYFDLEDFKYREICDAGVDAFLQFLKEGNYLQSPRTLVFLDEIQLLQNPSSFLKLIYDHHPEIKLIVTGSSTFAIRKKFKDSLVGRTVTFELYPLSFQEFLVFKEQSFDVSKPIETPVFIRQLQQLFTEYVRFGGYPKIVLTAEKDKKEMYLRQIVDTYLKADIRDLADIRNIDKFNRLLRVLAQQSASLLNVNELSVTTGISKPTLEEYLFILENTYVIRRVSPFSRNLRKELFKRPKIFLLDTGLMHILHLNTVPDAVLGPAFETAFFSELVKNSFSHIVHFWRTKDKKEIDFILELPDRLVALEVKRNAAQLKPRVLHYFREKYPADAYGICLEIPQVSQKSMCLYPWEIYKHIPSWKKAGSEGHELSFPN